MTTLVGVLVAILAGVVAFLLLTRTRVKPFSWQWFSIVIVCGVGGGVIAATLQQIVPSN